MSRRAHPQKSSPRLDAFAFSPGGNHRSSFATCHGDFAPSRNNQPRSRPRRAPRVEINETSQSCTASPSAPRTCPQRLSSPSSVISGEWRAREAPRRRRASRRPSERGTATQNDRDPARARAIAELPSALPRPKLPWWCADCGAHCHGPSGKRAKVKPRPGFAFRRARRAKLGSKGVVTGVSKLARPTPGTFVDDSRRPVLFDPQVVFLDSLRTMGGIHVARVAAF